MKKFPKVYDPQLVEHEEARFALPYTDGIVEYIKKHDDRVEIVRVKLDETEWNALRGSTALQCLVLV